MKTLVLNAMRATGVFAATRAFSAHLGRILTYHNFCAFDDGNPDAVPVHVARAHLEHLRRHFEVVPLLKMAEQLASGRELDGRSVALTIDDGRQNFYQYLYPLLQEFGLPATFFVVTSFIDGQDWIWTDKVLWLSRQPGAPPVLAPENLTRYFSELNRCSPEDRNRRIAALAAGVGLIIPAQPPVPYQPCSWAQLREMADSGLVDIGSHTVSHPILSSISEEETWRELTDSRSRIEAMLGRAVPCFCFPNGARSDYRTEQVEQVKDAGYACSVTTDFGFVNKDADRYRLPRIGAGRSDLMVFYKRIDGLMYYLGQR